jgi:hypothetical protein
MLEGYIIEFAAENHQSFSWAEEIFKKGARGRLLREIPLWIKAFLMEEGMLIMSPTRDGNVNTLAWGRARQGEGHGMRKGKGSLTNGGETKRNGFKR